jgi:hypothetical protein
MIGISINIKFQFRCIYFSNYFLSIIVSVVCPATINIFKPRAFNLEFQHFISIFNNKNNHFPKKYVLRIERRAQKWSVYEYF